ncbi:replication protein A 70 kDa dna-binding subunit, partial [Trifolium medium]|nr:replication protein A 70 kDa dna-binding subunit [Trifolium medium]
IVNPRSLPMASIITPVSAIVGGKINFKLKVRLIHVWTIPEFNNPAENQCLHMLMLDEQVAWQDTSNCKEEFGGEDIIGHIVEKDQLKETEKNSKRNKLIDITLEDPEGIRIHCTLWNEHAERLDNFLANYESTSPVIVLMQLCKLKKFYGIMGVSNAFYGTKLILNGDLPIVNEYRSR